jgi:hypothetical protein
VWAPALGSREVVRNALQTTRAQPRNWPVGRAEDAGQPRTPPAGRAKVFRHAVMRFTQAPKVATYGITHAQVEDLIQRTRDTSERNDVIALRGPPALAVVNGLQRVRANTVFGLTECLWYRIPYQWLDSTARVIDLPAQRRQATRLLVNLAAHSEEVPDGYYLTNVKYNPLVPTWFGAFSDVHEGTWSRLGTVTRVVVKRLRVNEGPEQEVIHKVRGPSSCSPLAYQTS